MKCIVTAGPTYEELDDVRRMTNFSTGALGSKLANYLVQQGHEVELLLGHYSTCRIESKAQRVQVFTTSDDLKRRLQRLGSNKINAVFHAAAVCDFTFGKIWRRAPGGKLMPVNSRKISTRSGPLLAELTATPKIIGHLRSWYPNAYLVGWKYELEGGRAHVIAQAKRQLEENHTDACVVNGRAYGRGFGLVTTDGRCRPLRDAKALFAALVEFSAHGEPRAVTQAR
jgi:phosphopantothenoylcysteine decarboxylase/phosphopantothenate--cysteine ligase